MADEEFRPIIIKRIKKQSGHQGGAWKIAYADFVTAMMAFFLLMWLIGSTAKGDLEGIAEYFKTPLKVAMAGGVGSGTDSSVIQGGGRDLMRVDGQQQKGPEIRPSKAFSLKDAEAQLEKAELDRLNLLKKRIEKAIDNNPALRMFKKQLLIDITSEGLRIQIVDEQNRPMFALASAELQPYTRRILQEIGRMLNDVPNRISISGHTDAKPYANGEKKYSNWELSADRANASRRELISGGMNEAKLVRVVGLSSAVLFDQSDPYNPINRRISLIVMNKKAEKAVINEGAGSLEVAKSEDVQPGLTPATIEVNGGGPANGAGIARTEVGNE